ncbi:MAG TPA: hypothetical protein DCS28_01215 [Candidatus Moranbacteria bacterium]|nr:hypothetical protein [Candidatus Moranbacteria bacterium]HAT74646.1 hypothetical protein [Candidatus Moranbacteria bacterium]
MSQTLYRKYRPKNFSEIIGQTHIARTLSNAIKNNRIAHSYLFTGPRGTGKTSFARIFAKTINCSNLIETENETNFKINSCENCQSCRTIQDGQALDIIEIDAASNTGVDNIRELKETIALPPTLLKYKVYIIDEAHMLSTGAFNALLKTLEEPPAHVVFILATTEIHKVPQTIISRCQRFDFPRLPMTSIIEKLTLIAQAEKITIKKDALEMIALSAEGGMRDAESLLGQIISLEDKNITAKEVEEILGAVDKNFVVATAEEIILKNSSRAIGKINELIAGGYDLQIFTKALINYFRQLMLIKIDANFKNYFTNELTEEKIEILFQQSAKIELPQIVAVIDLLLEAQYKLFSFLLPQLSLEIAIIKATQNFPAREIIVEKNAPLKISEKITTAPPAVPKNEPINIEPIKQPEKLTAINPTAIINPDNLKSNWNKLLTEIRPYNHSIGALLLNCQILKTEGNVVSLATPYDFYKEKLNEPQNRLTIEKVFSKILGLAVRIQVVVDKTLAPIQVSNAEEELMQTETKETSNRQQSSLLSSAMEIMGGKIVE